MLAEVRRYDDAAALEVADLVDEQIRTLAVRVVGDHDAMAILLLQLFEDLEGFRARGGAHVQNNVVFLDVEEHRRKHAHGFLAADVAGERERYHVLVKILEGFHLAELLAVEIDLRKREQLLLLATLLLLRTTRSGEHSQSAGLRIPPSHQSDTWS